MLRWWRGADIYRDCKIASPYAFFRICCSCFAPSSNRSTMMGDPQTKFQSDSPQDPQTESGQHSMEIEQQQPRMVVHRRKRGKTFWILMALFNVALIIGFLKLVILRQSDNDESADANLAGNERQNEPSRIIGGSPSYQNKYPYFGKFLVTHFLLSTFFMLTMIFFSCSW